MTFRDNLDWPGVHSFFAPGICFAPDKGAGTGKPDDEEEDEKLIEGSESDDEHEEDGDDEKESDSSDSDESADSDDDEQKRISDREAQLLKESMSRKKKLKDAEAKLQELQSKLRNYEGLDPEEARTAVKSVKESKLKEAEKRGEFDKVKKQMLEDHQKTVDKLNASIEELRQESLKKENIIHDLTIGNSFNQSDFIAKELVLTPTKARVVYKDHFEVQDGNVVAYDKPKSASDRAPLVDGNGDPLRFDEALRKIVESDPDKDALVRSKMKSGADSSTVNKKVAEKKKDLSGQEKIASGLSSLRKKTGS